MIEYSTYDIGKASSISYIKCNKFKNAYISFNMFLPLKKCTASVNAVLPGVLEYSSSKYPCPIALNKKIEDLYGACVSSGVSKMGDYQVLDVSISSLNNKYVDIDIFNELINLIVEMIFNQNLENGIFCSKAVEIEKNQTIGYIKSELNDKKYYAFSKCESLIYENQTSNVCKYGEINDIIDITDKSLTDNYYKALNSSYIKVMIANDELDYRVCDIFENKLSFRKNFEIFSFKNYIKDPKFIKLKSKVESSDVEQCKFVMGFSTGVCGINSESAAMALMVSVLGGTPNSKLFVNVREKLNLCYYCSSRYDRNKGSVFVESGVESENLEKAKEEILNQLELIKNGEVTGDELEGAKKYVSQMYRNVEDNLESLNSWYVSQVMYNNPISPKEMSKFIQDVSLDDMVNAANKVKLDSIFSLCNI